MDGGTAADFDEYLQQQVSAQGSRGRAGSGMSARKAALRRQTAARGAQPAAEPQQPPQQQQQQPQAPPPWGCPPADGYVQPPPMGYAFYPGPHPAFQTMPFLVPMPYPHPAVVGSPAAGYGYPNVPPQMQQMQQPPPQQQQQQQQPAQQQRAAEPAPAPVLPPAAEARRQSPPRRREAEGAGERADEWMSLYTAPAPDTPERQPAADTQPAQDASRRQPAPDTPQRQPAPDTPQRQPAPDTPPQEDRAPLHASPERPRSERPARRAARTASVGMPPPEQLARLEAVMSGIKVRSKWRGQGAKMLARIRDVRAMVDEAERGPADVPSFLQPEVLRKDLRKKEEQLRQYLLKHDVHEAWQRRAAARPADAPKRVAPARRTMAEFARGKAAREAKEQKAAAPPPPRQQPKSVSPPRRQSPPRPPPQWSWEDQPVGGGGGGGGGGTGGCAIVVDMQPARRAKPPPPSLQRRETAAAAPATPDAKPAEDAGGSSRRQPRPFLKRGARNPRTFVPSARSPQTPGSASPEVAPTPPAAVPPSFEQSHCPPTSPVLPPPRQQQQQQQQTKARQQQQQQQQQQQPRPSPAPVRKLEPVRAPPAPPETAAAVPHRSDRPAEQRLAAQQQPEQAARRIEHPPADVHADRAVLDRRPEPQQHTPRAVPRYERPQRNPASELQRLLRTWGTDAPDLVAHTFPAQLPRQDAGTRIPRLTPSSNFLCTCDPTFYHTIKESLRV